MVIAEKEVPSVATAVSMEISGVGACNVTVLPVVSSVAPSAGASFPEGLPPEQPTRSNRIISKDNNFFISVLLITFLILMQLKTRVNKNVIVLQFMKIFSLIFSCMIIMNRRTPYENPVS